LIYNDERVREGIDIAEEGDYDLVLLVVASLYYSRRLSFFCILQTIIVFSIFLAASLVVIGSRRSSFVYRWKYAVDILKSKLDNLDEQVSPHSLLCRFEIIRWSIVMDVWI